MTANARKAWTDLQRAHRMLEDETDNHRFRVLWVAAISLARAVGHVLKNIDGPSSEQMRKAVQLAYASWKENPDEHEIFNEFIESERNSVLKEYEFGYLAGPVSVTVTTGETYTLEASLFSPISDGPYAGEDCRDVLKLAIEWWHAELIKIERALPSNNSLQARRP